MGSRSDLLLHNPPLVHRNQPTHQEEGIIVGGGERREVGPSVSFRQGPGPASCGKTTLGRQLARKYPKEFHFTSRAEQAAKLPYNAGARALIVSATKDAAAAKLVIIDGCIIDNRSRWSRFSKKHEG